MKWYYDTVDLGPFLKEGENSIAVEVLRYPMNSRKGNYGVFRTETPGLYVKEKPGKVSLGLNADATWKCWREKEFHIVSENPFLHRSRFWRSAAETAKRRDGNTALTMTANGKR